MTDATVGIEYGWTQARTENMTRALMTQLGVTDAVTCSSGAALRPTELWSATNVGLVRLTATGLWEGVEASVTPWREVHGIEITARADDSGPDPAAVVKVAHPAVNIEVLRRSGLGGSRGQQWPFVTAMLRHLGSAATAPK
jgi:hypothetical protein